MDNERTEKPHKGTIDEWRLTFCGQDKYIIVGRFRDHPEFAGQEGHTSAVISVNFATREVETRNSRYRLGVVC